MESKKKFISVLSLCALSLGIFACKKVPDESNESQKPSASSDTASVVEAVYTLSVDKDVFYLDEGEEEAIIATLLKDQLPCNDPISFLSNDPSIATVDASGTIKGISEGSTTIVVSAHGEQKEVKVEVMAKEVFMVLNYNTCSLNVNDTLQLVATLTDGSTPALTFESLQEDIAEISDSGLIIGKSEGTATIVVSTPDGVNATCVVTVKNTYELIFPKLEKDEFMVGDTIDLNTVVKVNGNLTTEGISITGEKFTVDGDTITIVDDGLITITVSYPGQEPIIQEITAFTAISSQEDFAKIMADPSGYYKLVNDIDFSNGKLETICHYSAGYTSSSNGFSGIFDGQGYSIMNYYSVYQGASTSNCSVFGTIAASGIVKNTNFIHATINNRISGAVATINYGTIDNCFADVYVTYDTKGTDQNNPIGGIVSKNYNTVTNCVTVLKVQDGINTTNIGAIAGRNNNNYKLMKNCYSLSDMPLTESAKPTNDYTENSYGVHVEDSYVVSTVAALNALSYDSFSDYWTLKENCYPHLGEVNPSITAENTSITAYQNSSVQLQVTSSFPVNYYLSEEVENVQIDAEGKLTIGAVAAETIIEVIATNYYSEETITFEIIVAEPEFTIDDSAFQSLSFSLIRGISDESAYRLEHHLSVLLGGEIYAGERVRFVSSDSSIISVDYTTVTALSTGSVTIRIFADENEIYSFDVDCMIYSPIRTVEEFLAIGTSQETLSGHYLLMNDLDFANANIQAFTSYKTYTSSLKTAFSGSFDGQGHTIYRFAPDYNRNDASDRDRSLFGYMTSTAIVKNVNFIGVIGYDRISVVSSWCEGTIENVYIEMEYRYFEGKNKTAANPGGVVVAKVRPTAKISDCIVVLTFTSDAEKENMGGIAGVVSAGAKIENCYFICSDATVNAIFNNLATATAQAVKVSSAEEFYQSDRSQFDTEIWTFEETKYPHVGTIEVEMTANQTVYNVYANATLQLQVTSLLKAHYEMVSEIENVTIDENGKLTIGDVSVDTQIQVRAYNVYNDSFVIFNIVIIEAEYEVDLSAYQDIEFHLISGVSEEESYVQPHHIGILLNGAPYSGENITFVSSDESIIIADQTSIRAISDGAATIYVKADDVDIYTFDVVVNIYQPVYTIADFEAINQNEQTRAGKYALMNDLDYQGGVLTTIAHYNDDGSTSSSLGFSGIFDGQGHSIFNYSKCLGKNNTATNSSPFGNITSTGIVRNTNFIGGYIENRIAGGVATVNYGTIENCYVEITINYNTNGTDQNNPIGGIVSKNYKTIKNCVVVLHIKDGIDMTNIGAIIGRNYENKNELVSNCYALAIVGVSESKTPTNGYMVDSMGVSKVVNCEVTDDLTALLSFLNNDETFNDLWTIEAQCYPHLGIVTPMETESTQIDVSANSSCSLSISSTVSLQYELVEENLDVFVDQNGLVTIGEVAVGTDITILVSNPYQIEKITIVLHVVQ